MKTSTLSAFFIFLICFAFAQNNNEDILTNQTIIQLTKIGLQPSVIISKIRTSATKFDVSTDALINLGNNAVASDVINEMIKVNTEHKLSLIHI